jgi:hypothetical protein
MSATDVMKGNLVSRNRQMRPPHATRRNVASRPSNGASMAMCTDFIAVEFLLDSSGRSH